LLDFLREGSAGGKENSKEQGARGKG
jgi:hypothetical protein